MRGAIEHLWDDAGLRKFGVLYQEDAYGVDLLDGIKEGLKAHNAEISGLGSYVRNVNDIDKAYADIKAAKPEVVFLAAVATPAAKFVKKARADGWNPVFVTNSGAGADVFATAAGEAGEGVIGTEAFPSLSRTDLPTVAQYVKAQKQYFPDEAPTLAGLRGYINMLVLEKGLKETGKELDREKLVESLEKLHDVDVGLGHDKLSFGVDDHTGLHAAYYTIVKGGKAVGFDGWKSLAK
jgi:ABC-type branched-subunit amino acid transport system substrate-binding protein